ncbi:methyl-accepting chemotaxis protein [Rhizobium sp. TH2]|uniref:hypothetical protein n=1 Tax=Rhizobium sp. TH2 TaxID=2775403 RepID=UPI00215810CD|nr:hypothetical protein [Rhizobium sp. TH2]UVC10383.1 methyl-accepting chemotaxis protein [Rhizobium sp. TH2]
MLDQGAGSAIFRNGLFSFFGRALRMICGGGRTGLKDEAHLQRGGSASALKPDLHQAALISVADPSQGLTGGKVHHSTAVADTPACMSKPELETAVEAMCLGLGRLSVGSFEPMSPHVFNVQFNPLVQSFNRFGSHLQASLGEIHRSSEGLARGLRVIDHANNEIADRSNRLTKALEDGQRPFQKVKIFGAAIDCEARKVEMLALGTSVAAKVGKVRADQAEKSLAMIETYAERIDALVQFVQSAQASLIDETDSTEGSPSIGAERSKDAAAAGRTPICEAMNDIQELTARIAKETAKCLNVLKQLSGTHSEMDISAESLRHKSHAIAEQAYHLDQAIGEFSGHMRKAHHESQRLQSASSPISTLVDDLTLASHAQRSILSALGANGRSVFVARREASSFAAPSTSDSGRVMMFPMRGRSSERS